MPKGPQGQQRPSDGAACAVMVAKIATGGVEETKTNPVLFSNKKGDPTEFDPAALAPGHLTQPCQRVAVAG
jgi:hypothetical protein